MKPWLKIWPKELPQEIKPPKFTIPELIMENKINKPDFLIYEDGLAYSYENIINDSKRFSNFLKDNNVKRGNGIVLMSYNSPEVIPILLSALMIGVRVALIDPLTSGEDLRLQLSITNPKLIITDSEIVNREKDVLSNYRVWVKENFKDVIKSYNDEISVSAMPEDIAISMHYAGVIGRTYEVYHTQYNIAMNIYTSAFIREKELGRGITSLVSIPLSHIFGLNAILESMISGNRIVLMKKFLLDKAIDLMEKYRVNVVSGPPTIFKELFPYLKKSGIMDLKVGITGAAPVPPELQKAYFEELNLPLVQTYGLTEGLGVTFQPISLKVYGSVGIPLPNVDVKIVDPQTGKEVQIGKEGELLVKSPWIMKGYGANGIIDMEETKKAIEDGWLHTGDIFVMDEKGLLYFRGLKKRFLKYKGYPILPRDLEIILEQHPAVKKAYVDGEFDPEVGHKVYAKVVLKDEYKGKVSEEELLNYVNSKVAFYKKIRRIIFVDNI